MYLTIHCLAGVGWILDFMARGDLRKRYGIKGSAFGDCCTACWCMPCTQRQHHRELLVEEEQQWQAMQSVSSASLSALEGLRIDPLPAIHREVARRRCTPTRLRCRARRRPTASSP